MRIWSVTPIAVGPQELARRQERYDRLSPLGVSVHLSDIGDAAPRALDTDEQVRASERAVVAALWRVPDGYDAVMPDCVLDPGVAELQESSDLPVIGILRLNLAHAAALAAPTAAVVRNEAIAREMRAVSEAYGWDGLLTEIAVTDLDVEAIADHARWQAELDRVADDLAPTGVRRLLNGCSAVDPDPGRQPGLQVVDPVARALRLVGAGA